MPLVSTKFFEWPKKCKRKFCKIMMLKQSVFRCLPAIALLACTTRAQFSVSVGTITSDCLGCDMQGSPQQTGCTVLGGGVKVPCSVIISIDIAQNSMHQNATTSASVQNSTTTTPVSTSFLSTTTSLGPTITSHPPYIRPSENNQDCDLYGPLCQTGSITVAINASVPTSTAVACSDYLSAQAISVFPQFTRLGQLPQAGGLPEDWATSFGRSPQCTSFANAQASPLAFSNCNNASQTLSAPGYYVPPGVLVDQANAQQYSCCGNCQIHVDEVRIAYFPEHTDLECTRSADPSPNGTTPSTITPRPEVQSDGSASTVVVDGYTYTAPSIYLKVVGTAEVSDSCGVQPPVMTNPTIAIPSGGLTTISYEMTQGETFAEPRNHIAHTKALNLDDLACPTFGFSDPFNTTTTDSQGRPYTQYNVRTVGPPYNPVIVPPPELLAANSEWRCSTFEDENSPWVITFGIFDPPQVLTAHPALITHVPEPSANDPIVSAEPSPTETGNFLTSVTGGLVDGHPSATPVPDDPPLNRPDSEPSSNSHDVVAPNTSDEPTMPAAEIGSIIASVMGLSEPQTPSSEITRTNAASTDGTIPPSLLASPQIQVTTRSDGSPLTILLHPGDTLPDPTSIIPEQPIDSPSVGPEHEPGQGGSVDDQDIGPATPVTMTDVSGQIVTLTAGGSASPGLEVPTSATGGQNTYIVETDGSGDLTTVSSSIGSLFMPDLTDDAVASATMSAPTSSLGSIQPGSASIFRPRNTIMLISIVGSVISLML